MYSAGYIKDAIASIFFLISFCILLIIRDINDLKFHISTLILIAFLIDCAFTLFPKYHNTEFGYNIPSYMVVGATICFLIISIYAIKNEVLYNTNHFLL